MLIECVLGAVGLAIEQAAFEVTPPDRLGRLEDKIVRLDQRLRRRLASLIKRRRRIEVLKSRLQTTKTPATVERLRSAIARHEQAYQRRLLALKNGRRKLAQLQSRMASVEASV